MQLRFIVVGGTALVLAACAGAGDDSLKTSCLTVMQDPEVSEEVLEAGITKDAYCDCMVQSFSALPETDKDRYSGGMMAMADAMAETDGSAEDAFSVMREAARADEATPDAVSLYEDMRDLGEQLEQIMEDMEAGSGTCPSA